MPHRPHRTPSVPQLKQTKIIIGRTSAGVQQSNYTKLSCTSVTQTNRKQTWNIERTDLLCLDVSWQYWCWELLRSAFLIKQLQKTPMHHGKNPWHTGHHPPIPLNLWINLGVDRNTEHRYIVHVPVLLHVDHGPRLLWLRPRTHRAKTFQRGYGPCRNGFWQPKGWDMLRHFARFHDRGITQLTLIQQRICNPGHFDRSFEEGPLRLCLPLPPHCGTKPWTRQAPSSSGLCNIIPMGLAFSSTIYAVLPCSTKRAAVTPLIWQIWHGSDLIIFDLLWIHAGIKQPIRTYLHTNTGHTGPPRFQGISPASAARRSSFRRAWASSSPSMGRGHRGSKSKVISAWQAKSATVTSDPSVTEAVWNMIEMGWKCDRFG